LHASRPGPGGREPMSEQRIRLDGAPGLREEIVRDDDGFADLRMRIRQVHEEGDQDELSRLQGLYRNRHREPMAARAAGIGTIVPKRPAPAATSMRESDRHF